VQTWATLSLTCLLRIYYSEDGTRVVNYEQMCTEWNEIVVSEMEAIQLVSPDVQVDQLFDRLRLKTTSLLSSYAGQVTDRYHGVEALKPYLDEYKRLCHDLKEPNADLNLASPQVNCTSLTPKPTERLQMSKSTLPIASNFAKPAAIRPVIIKSAALEEANRDNSQMVLCTCTLHCLALPHLALLI
jgi:hypothetical protein